MACFACARDGRILRRGTRWGTDMRKLAAVLFGVAAWLVTGGSAWAAIEVEVVEAWPAGDAVTIGKIGRAHSELQSLMRNSYAVFCLKKKNAINKLTHGI